MRGERRRQGDESSPPPPYEWREEETSGGRRKGRINKEEGEKKRKSSPLRHEKERGEREVVELFFVAIISPSRAQKRGTREEEEARALRR